MPRARFDKSVFTAGPATGSGKVLLNSVLSCNYRVRQMFDNKGPVDARSGEPRADLKGSDLALPVEIIR